VILKMLCGGSAKRSRRLKDPEYAGMALEGRIARGEIEIASGKVAAGRATLAAVRRDAQRKGYGLIADKALKAVSASALSGSAQRSRGDSRPRLSSRA
jgi:hypothetical protein